MTLTTTAKVKKYILRELKKRRPGWKCSRVSQGALDTVEAEFFGIVREFIKDPTPKDMKFEPVDDLLTTSRVHQAVVDLLKSRYPWVKIHGVSDELMTYLEYRLEHRLNGHIQSHPSRGKTFTL